MFFGLHLIKRDTFNFFNYGSIAHIDFCHNFFSNNPLTLFHFGRAAGEEKNRNGPKEKINENFLTQRTMAGDHIYIMYILEKKNQEKTIRIKYTTLDTDTDRNRKMTIHE